MSNVVQLLPREALITKQQLARHLGRSTRWVELRVRDGMPSEPPTKRFPHRRFRLGDVESWFRGGGRPTLPAHSDRLAVLESEVASLRALRVPAGDLLVASDQRRTGVAPDEAHASPQVGVDLERSGSTSVQLDHAALAFGLGGR